MRKRTLAMRLFCLTAVLVLCLAQGNFALAAETKTTRGLTYLVQEDGTAIITKYVIYSAAELDIPEELDGYKVTAIDSKAFNLHGELQRVSVPDTVVSIGAKAFAYCDGITQLSLSKSLKTLGARAFSTCKGLRSVTLPGTLETVGEKPLCPLRQPDGDRHGRRKRHL